MGCIHTHCTIGHANNTMHVTMWMILRERRGTKDGSIYLKSPGKAHCREFWLLMVEDEMVGGNGTDC